MNEKKSFSSYRQDAELKHVSDAYDKTCKADAEIQSFARWTHDNKNAFIHSIVTGLASDGVILADTKSSYDANSSDISSVEYFGSLMASGIDYLIIDGNNRLKAIYEFLNNKFQYHGPSVKVVTKDNSIINLPQGSFFEDLNQETQDVISKLTIPATIYTDLSREGAGALYSARNSGVQLKAAEKANAYGAPVVGVIRKCAMKIRAINKFPRQGLMTYNSNPLDVENTIVDRRELEKLLWTWYAFLVDPSCFNISEEQMIKHARNPKSILSKSENLQHLPKITNIITSLDASWLKSRKYSSIGLTWKITIREILSIAHYHYNYDITKEQINELHKKLVKIFTAKSKLSRKWETLNGKNEVIWTELMKDSQRNDLVKVVWEELIGTGMTELQKAYDYKFKR